MTEQLAIQFHTHGGKRRGAGRKPAGERRVSHKARPAVNARHPQHVVLHVADDVPSLRTEAVLTEVRAAIAKANERGGMQVVHWSIQGNHLHMLNEAASAEALSRGMQGLAIRLAHAINRATGHAGRVFADHYFARPLATPTEVRNALGYVLANDEVHALRAKRWITGELDAFTSAARAIPTPRTWLLREGWLRARRGPPLPYPVREALWQLHRLG